MDSSETETATLKLIDTLDEIHREPLSLAIMRVLSTDIAEITFAQIVDGLPLADVADDSSNSEPHSKHPIREHKELCPGVLEKTRDFRRDFQPGALRFESKLLLAYQAASPGSRAFKTRLIELVAVAIHQIAVLVFELDTSLHKHDSITDWAPPKLPPESTEPFEDWMFWEQFPKGPLPTLLQHSWYLDYEQYPNGVADMVGYWAEGRILGGVVLFDRRPDGDSDHVYMLPDRRKVTYRIFQLLPEQKSALIEFFTADSDPSTDTLPILADENNLRRVDPEEPIESTGIYRDIWERNEREPTSADRRLRDVWEVFDFPTHQDKYEASLRAQDRKARWDYGNAYYDAVGR